jgi:hypothetical protein
MALILLGLWYLRQMDMALILLGLWYLRQMDISCPRQSPAAPTSWRYPVACAGRPRSRPGRLRPTRSSRYCRVDVRHVSRVAVSQITIARCRDAELEGMASDGLGNAGGEEERVGRGFGHDGLGVRSGLAAEGEWRLSGIIAGGRGMSQAGGDRRGVNSEA